MKTKEEIFEDAGNAEDFAPKVEVYSKTHAFQRADEYAEEHTKAFVKWYMGWDPILDEPAIRGLNTSLLHFKESLKK